MKLPRYSVRRPVLTTMVTLIVVLLGLVSLSRLRIDLLPTIELPTVTVRTGYAGASPEVMEQQVTRIIEEIIATVPGVEEMTSYSSDGYSQVRVSFSWGTDIDTAALDVQSKLEDEINELPDEIDRPRVNKFDIESFPVVLVGISSDLDPVELTELIENQIRYRFARIPGVAQVDLWGGFDREIRVELDPDRIKALGLSMNRLLQAIRDSNLDLPAGQIEQGQFELTLRAPAQFTSVQQIRDMVLDTREGGAIRLDQVGEVRDTFEKRNRYVRVNGERGIRVAIRKQADANTVEVSKAILEEIEEANADYPQVNIIPVINQGNFIERSIANVARSVLYGGGLAIIVLLFFLRNIRSTFVISLAIPISIIATFALIYFGGFTLNLMTLGGLALGVGMMVDSSIVVLENIFRRRDEHGDNPAEAAERGAEEVGPAIIASTITTLVIFLPLIFVQGVSGVLFQELAYVIAFSLVCSLLVSLSLVPMLSSRLLRRNPEAARGAPDSLLNRLAGRSERMFASVDNGYRDLLRWVLRHRLGTVVTAFALVAGSFLLLPLIGSEFLPPSDEGEVRIGARMAVGTRLDVMDRQMLKLEALIEERVPEKVSSVTTVRTGRGDINIALTPATRRDRSNTEIADALRKELRGSVAGTEINVWAPQGQFILGRILPSGGGMDIEIRGPDLDVLNALAERAEAAVAEVPGVNWVNRREEEGVPQEEIQVDRAKVADLGLSVRDVAQVVRTAIAGSQAGEYRTQGNAYRILVQLQDAERLSIEDVLGLTLSTPSGEQVALGNLARTTSGRGPRAIERDDQQREVSVDVNIEGENLGAAATRIQSVLDQIPRPEGYEVNVAGNFREQQEAFAQLVVSLLLAILLVYMVLASQYESLRNPLVVMFSVPMAAVGVLLTLFVTQTTLNLQSYIGCIMLGGIVVNNAILLVDQAGNLDSSGMPVNEAVAEAGRRRLRPILMTTLTTILGLMPLALGIGEGADQQAPLARAVVGGLAGSTLITLVLIPAIYSLMHRGGPGKHTQAA